MNKGQLADGLPARTGMGKAAALQAVDGVFAEIAEALARGDEVRLPGFGAFVTRNRPARMARRPRTGETVQVPAATVPAFKAGKPLKNAVNAGGGS